MKFKSCAQWPKGTFDSLGNYTEDTHDTPEAAQGVCDLLCEQGAGGDGLAFPVHTWVREIRPDREKTAAELAEEVFDPRVSDLAYFLSRMRDLGL